MNDTTSNQLNIFLSHKREDYKVAQDIREQLEAYGAGKIRFFLSEEIPVGKDWHTWIDENVAGANWFMLLFTNPTSSWDWCLFEAGMFRAGMAGDSRLICLHNKSVQSPEQLSKFQGIKAESESVKEFVRQLYGTPVTEDMPEINLNLVQSTENMDELVDKICSIMSSKSQNDLVGEYYYNKYIDININSFEDLQNTSGMRNAEIASDSMLEDIFGIKILPSTWGQFVDLIEEQYKRESYSVEDFSWTEEICFLMQHADKGISFEQGKSTVRALKDGQIYRPILHCMRRPVVEENRFWEFKMIFVLWN